ncbi:hypothetical protein TYRP_021132 [Tyrophagus putrescentiae]|nr:hypothetical protein TYRP_021132 [Tyrophagus putrescentiae]
MLSCCGPTTLASHPTAAEASKAPSSFSAFTTLATATAIASDAAAAVTSIGSGDDTIFISAVPTEDPRAASTNGGDDVAGRLTDAIHAKLHPDSRPPPPPPPPLSDHHQNQYMYITEVVSSTTVQHTFATNVRSDDIGNHWRHMILRSSFIDALRAFTHFSIFVLSPRHAVLADQVLKLVKVLLHFSLAFELETDHLALHLAAHSRRLPNPVIRNCQKGARNIADVLQEDDLLLSHHGHHDAHGFVVVSHHRDVSDGAFQTSSSKCGLQSYLPRAVVEPIVTHLARLGLYGDRADNV